jgi:3',5'-cyclic AMP phosphodiesterase CpdA
MPNHVAVRELGNKRAFGFLSWQWRRRHIHRPEVLDALRRDLMCQAPHHVVVTGDVVNVSLPEEFERAALWLAGLGPADQVSVIPGNHDAYVAVPWTQSWRWWEAFMTGDDPGRVPASGSPRAFPFVRRQGAVAIIGVSTAEPTMPGLASGRLGAEQGKRLEHDLETLGAQGFCRVVLLHHPPFPSWEPPRKRLRDGDRFLAIVARSGAELVLHGHSHRFRQGVIPTAGGMAQVYGVASASALPWQGHAPAEYHIYEIARNGDRWSIGLRRRRYQTDRAAFDALPIVC